MVMSTSLFHCSARGEGKGMYLVPREKNLGMKKGIKQTDSHTKRIQSLLCISESNYLKYFSWKLTNIFQYSGDLLTDTVTEHFSISPLFKTAHTIAIIVRDVFRNFFMWLSGI